MNDKKEAVQYWYVPHGDDGVMRIESGLPCYYIDNGGTIEKVLAENMDDWDMGPAGKAEYEAMQAAEGHCCRIDSPLLLTDDAFNRCIEGGRKHFIVGRYIIDDQMAATLLSPDHNSCNRGFRNRNLETLKQRWANSEFQFTGEPIQISQEGKLLNGQHRLRATKETGVPIDVLMIFGLPQEVFSVLDQGAKRNWSDVLSAQGHQHAKKLAGAIAQLEAYHGHQFGRNYTAYRHRNGRHKGNEEVVQLVQKYPDLDVSVAKTLTSPFIAHGVLAATHYLTSAMSPEESESFISVFKNHDNVAQPTLFQQNALHLRSRLLKAKTDGQPLQREATAAYVVKAWNASREGRELKVFRWNGDKSPSFK